MKIIKILFLLILGSCSLFEKQEERFVNPLFYETLSCISQNHEVRLSPQKIIFTASHIPFEEMSCSLLKNENTEIVFSCTIQREAPYTLLFKYVLTDSYHYEGCRIVEQYTYRPNTTEWNGRTGYCLKDDKP